MRLDHLLSKEFYFSSIHWLVFVVVFCKSGWSKVVCDCVLLTDGGCAWLCDGVLLCVVLIVGLFVCCVGMLLGVWDDALLC